MEILKRAYTTREAAWHRARMHAPVDGDGDGTSGGGVGDAFQEETDLQGEGGEEQRESQGRKAVATQEGHQEAKADQNHHLYVPEHCREVEIKEVGR